MVIIAIIGVLAALLLPSLAETKERAKIPLCLSSLRQMSIMVSLYYGDYGTVPPGQRDMNQMAFGCGTETVGLGFFTWYGYCADQRILACPASNYRPGSEWQTPFDSGKPYDFGPGYYWAVFRQPNCFPMRGKQAYLYGDANGNSIYKGYGNTSSYSYRRSAFQDKGYGTGPDCISRVRVRLDELPNVYVACAQQYGTTQGWGGCANANFTHRRRGSCVLHRDGHANWVSLMVRRDLAGLKIVPANHPENAGCPPGYLPYVYSFDYPYTWPAEAFWEAAEQG